jgi:hypothetical protein
MRQKRGCAEEGTRLARAEVRRLMVPNMPSLEGLRKLDVPLTGTFASLRIYFVRGIVK